MANKRRKRYSRPTHNSTPPPCLSSETLNEAPSRKALRKALIIDNVCPVCLSDMAGDMECPRCYHVAWEEFYDK